MFMLVVDCYTGVMKHFGNRSLIIVSIITTVVAVGTFIYVQGEDDPAKTGSYARQNGQPAPTSGAQASGDYMTVRGTVTSVDLSKMQVDGEGIYMVQGDRNKMYEVRLASGESSCEIYNQNDEGVIGKVQRGASVEVRGKNRDGTLAICDANTYIKAL